MVTATEEMTLKFDSPLISLNVYVIYTTFTVMWFLIKINRYVPHDPAIPLLGV